MFKSFAFLFGIIFLHHFRIMASSNRGRGGLRKSTSRESLDVFDTRSFKSTPSKREQRLVKPEDTKNKPENPEKYPDNFLDNLAESVKKLEINGHGDQPRDEWSSIKYDDNDEYDARIVDWIQDTVSGAKTDKKKNYETWDTKVESESSDDQWKVEENNRNVSNKGVIAKVTDSQILVHHNNQYMKRPEHKLQRIVKTIFPPNMIVKVYSSSKKIFPHKIGSMDIIIVKNIFDNDVLWPALQSEFESLKNELGKSSLFNETRHGNSHTIMDRDILEKFQKTEIYPKIKNRIVRYFHNMLVADGSERVNYYRSEQGKPHHQDAPATIENRAFGSQNITVAASFGREASIVEFRQILGGSTPPIRIYLEAGDVYAFGESINLAFTHCVVKLNDSKVQQTPSIIKERLSIILWGHLKDKFCYDNSGFSGLPKTREIDEMKSKCQKCTN